MKYHINAKGVPAVCRAVKRPCPLGGEDLHFDNIEAAQAHADEKMMSAHGLLGGKRKVNIKSEYVRDLHFATDASKLDGLEIYDSGYALDVADGDFSSIDVNELDVDEYAETLTHSFQELDELGDPELMDEFLTDLNYYEYAEEHEDVSSFDDFLYNGGLEEYLEYTDVLVQVKKGKLDYSWEAISIDTLNDLSDEMQSIVDEEGEDEMREADFRRSVGF